VDKKNNLQPSIMQLIMKNPRGSNHIKQ